MANETTNKHIPLPKETPAFFCANCGAVSLDANSICKVQGKGKKMDWCGTKDQPSPQQCHNRVNTIRFQCQKCHKVSVNKGLLCEPEAMPLP
jgi:predicted RNA-binding Zn-ribbon protein involved in translation (DUF1610 family)